jgi:hypothetical protein
MGLLAFPPLAVKLLSDARARRAKDRGATDAETRLECIRLAAVPGERPETVVRAARAYFAFITAGEDVLALERGAFEARKAASATLSP